VPPFSNEIAQTYAHGESTTIAESEISSTLVALFNPLNSSGPIVLVTHDWPRTARLLRAHNIDTSAPNWREGVGELLGFERPRNGENQAAAGRNDNCHPDNANKSTNNGYSGYIDHDSKHECKVKPEVKEENSKLRLSSRRSLHLFSLFNLVHIKLTLGYSHSPTVPVPTFSNSPTRKRRRTTSSSGVPSR
jgi:hypothetical protein